MEKYAHGAMVFRALCDKSRLRIIDLIKDGETCSCVLLEDLTISQSTLSHHMKILSESGLITCRKEGKYTMYSLSTNSIKEAITTLEEMLNAGQSNPNRKCTL